MEIEATEDHGIERESPESEKGANRLSKVELIGQMKMIDSNLVQEKVLTALNAHSTLADVLKKQIEFYFGDPNLQKDHHLRELLSQHKKGYIELKVLLGFKKIEHLFQLAHVVKPEDKMAYLRQAVTSSQLLKLCKQRLRVKRIVPFDVDSLKNKEVIEDADLRMVYVEKIPSFGTLDMIANIFKKYGQILHIKFPREKKSEKQSTRGEGIYRPHKGFAFIEFSVVFT